MRSRSKTVPLLSARVAETEDQPVALTWDLPGRAALDQLFRANVRHKRHLKPWGTKQHRGEARKPTSGAQSFRKPAKPARHLHSLHNSTYLMIFYTCVCGHKNRRPGFHTAAPPSPTWCHDASRYPTCTPRAASANNTWCGTSWVSVHPAGAPRTLFYQTQRHRHTERISNSAQLRSRRVGRSHRGGSATGPESAGGRVATAPGSRLVRPGRCSPVGRAAAPAWGRKAETRDKLELPYSSGSLPRCSVIVTAGALVIMDTIHRLEVFALGSNHSSAASEDL